MTAKKTVKKTAKKSGMSPETGKKVKLISIICGSVFALAGIIAATIHFWPVKPPDPKTAPEAAIKFIASDHFKKMPKTSQFTYMEGFGDDRRAIFEQSQKLSEPERKIFRENMGRVFMAQRSKELSAFFKKSKEEQMAELDRDIARMKEWEKARAARSAAGNNQRTPAGGNNQNRPPRTPPTAQQQRERDAASNPASRAQMQVKRAMMQQRAAQTGK